MLGREEGPAPHAGPFDDHHPAAADRLIDHHGAGLARAPPTPVASTTASAFAASGRSAVASEGNSASWLFAVARDGQPPQRLAGVGQLDVKSRFGRRRPAQGHQLAQPLADLRRRRPAETDQRALALGEPLPQLGQGVVGQEDLGVAAEDHDLIRGQGLGVGEKLAGVLLDRPLLGGLVRRRRPPRPQSRGVCPSWNALRRPASHAAIFCHSNRPSASCTTLVSSIDRSADKRPHQELRVPIRLALQQQHADRLIDHPQQQRGRVVDRRDFARQGVGADFVPIQPRGLVRYVKDLLDRVVLLQRYVALLDHVCRPAAAQAEVLVGNDPRCRRLTTTGTR